MRCRACDEECVKAFKRNGYQYFYCDSCGTCQTLHIRQSDMLTENDNDATRNCDELCEVRRQRILEYCGSPDKIIDFGCGRGELVRYLQQSIQSVIGIEKDTKLTLRDIADTEIDAFLMIEVIEHLYNPVAVISMMKRKLKRGGIIYIETGTTDCVDNVEACDYCSPLIGHCTMYSIEGIKALADAAGFGNGRNKF